MGNAWRSNTPRVVLDGCYLLDGAAPVWLMFERLTKRRARNFDGKPLPLSYRDLVDASDRCVCELPAKVVEDLLEILDDLFLAWCSRDNGSRRID